MSHISLIMAGDEEGGLEKHVIELANGLAQLGEQVSLIAHAKYGERLVKEVNFQPVDLSKGRRNPFILWQLYQTIKQTQPDVIHVHANKAVSMIAPLLTWLNVPAVATLHGIKKNLNAYQQFDRVITVSHRAAKQFARMEKVRVVWNGIVPPVQKFAAKPWQADNIQAIAIGRLVPVKGFDVLIEAWQGIDAMLWIVGDGPEQAALQQQIDELKLADRISLLGYRADIAELIAASDLLVISSRREGGPYTLAEALLVERPVLSTDVGMVADILDQQFICPVEQPQVLHDLLKQHLQSPETLQDGFNSYYELAKQHLTLDAMLHHTRQVYSELITPPAGLE